MTDTNKTTEPAGPDEERPAGPSPRPRARERGRMRRRLREQRSMREALLMDLGALVFELHRHGRREPKLLQAKAAELSAVDAEVRALSEALDRDLGVVEITAAGIAGSCQHCGMLLSTQASFCASCGAPAKAGIEPAAVAPSGPALPSPSGDPNGEPAGVAEDIVADETSVHEAESEREREPSPEAEPVPSPELEESQTLPVVDEDEQAEPEPPPEAEIADEEPEPEPEHEPEPEPEPERAPEPEPEQESEPEPASRPAPVRVKRPMGRLERTLRGKRGR